MADGTELIFEAEREEGAIETMTDETDSIFSESSSWSGRADRQWGDFRRRFCNVSEMQYPVYSLYEKIKHRM